MMDRVSTVLLLLLRLWLRRMSPSLPAGHAAIDE
jgi:hypothetical protein